MRFALLSISFDLLFFFSKPYLIYCEFLMLLDEWRCFHFSLHQIATIFGTEYVHPILIVQCVIIGGKSFVRIMLLLLLLWCCKGDFCLDAIFSTMPKIINYWHCSWSCFSNTQIHTLERSWFFLYFLFWSVGRSVWFACAPFRIVFVKNS